MFHSHTTSYETKSQRCHPFKAQAHDKRKTMTPRTSILMAAPALFNNLIHPSLSAPVNTTATSDKFFKLLAFLH